MLQYNKSNKENCLTANIFNNLDFHKSESVQDANASRLYGNIVYNNFDDEDDNETQFMNISDNIYENLRPGNVPTALINGFQTNKNILFQNCQNNVINDQIISSSQTTTNVYLSSASTSQNGTCTSSNCSTITSGVSTLAPVFEDEPELYGMLFI